jgi:hypothetical protein
MEINIKTEICEKQVISLLAFTISAIFGAVLLICFQTGFNSNTIPYCIIEVGLFVIYIGLTSGSSPKSDNLSDKDKP